MTIATLLICPSCGQFHRKLIRATGFCRACTNEHRRGHQAVKA